MSEITLERIAEMRRLEGVATPGPWQPKYDCAIETAGFVLGTNKDGSMSKRHSGQLAIFFDSTGRRKRIGEDIALIVAMRNDLRSLLALATEALERREAETPKCGTCKDERWVWHSEGEFYYEGEGMDHLPKVRCHCNPATPGSRPGLP